MTTKEQRDTFDVITHDVDFCIVGGGMAGLCAALAAARNGAKTLLMQDRPMLGGNASSEVRMWICGAHGADNKETGILEEIMLENYYRNSGLKYSVWDTVMYEKAQFQENLTLLLNTSCNDLEMDGSRIASVLGWQSPAQLWHRINAKYFADCSGDSVLRISGAAHRWGREARDEFDESLAPEVADRKTMGNSLLLQLREVDEHVPFVPPEWAYKYTEDDLPNRNLKPHGNNFWWLEIGGEQDTIKDAAEIHNELLKIAYGVWDLIKNHPDGRGHKWELEWIGQLPGKRENVRYEGDHILTQNDVDAEGRFDDLVAYGGWSMDDHHPEAIHYPGEPTIFHPAPSPYGIPYRVLYSRNIDNLFFAGRNISATHMALSSTRVMATCAVIGQAMGTAAAIATKYDLSPRGVYEHKIRELQVTLMDQDAYLPWHTRQIPELTLGAQYEASEGDPEPLRNGIDRSLGREDNGWWGTLGANVAALYDEEVHVSQARFTFDSDLRKKKRMPCQYPRKGYQVQVPEMMMRDFDLEALQPDGSWQVVAEVRNNYQRLVTVPLDVTTRGLRFVVRASWGAEQVHVMAFGIQ
ncbi:FAD-dependent oxidoreductase [Chloroflexota bacterium]